MKTAAHDPTAPHPRTVLWLTKQRDECRACKNCDCKTVVSGGDKSESQPLRCKLTPKRRGNRYSHHEYCIDAREPGQPCGPDAQLFAPKKARK